MSIDAGLQQLVSGEINYRDVMATGLSGAVFGAAAGSSVKNRTPNIETGATIELFTDASGPLVKGASGVGPTDPKAVASNAMSMPNIPTGSQNKVIANNPYIPKNAGGNFTIMDYLPESARITRKGGDIIINGTAGNKHLRNIPSELELAKMGLKLKYNGPLKSEFKILPFKDSNGKLLLQNTMKTIVFEKIK